jgi:N-acetylmuramoyl-L-alanine amidase
MPGGKSVTPLFGSLVIILSLFLSPKKNEALAANGSANPYIIVIDPGHGGEDKGAASLVGKKPLYEKDVALGIAIRMARVLRDPKYTKPLGRRVKVLLTRESDKEISLEARSEIARSAKADLFLSIHSNSEPSGVGHGVETYFLNNTDQESDSKLEEIENRTSKKRDASLLIRSIAADAVVDSSKLAAETVHKSLVDHLRLRNGKVHDRGVKQAMFYVLLDAQVPAVLFEAFFLSNKRDAAFVSEGERRQEIAEGLAKGILRYLALL